MMNAELFFHSALMPFHSCVVTIFVLIIAETIGLFIGYRPSNFIRKLIPSWIKDSPILQIHISRFIVLLFFLINLSFVGYSIQLSSYFFQHDFFNSGLVFIPASIMAWFFTLFMIHSLNQVIKPYADVDIEPQLIGRYATIISGNARPGCSALARVRDMFGNMHYVNVEPEYGELELLAQVILIDVEDLHYLARRITSPHQDD